MRILFTNFHQGYGGGHDTYILSLVQALKDSHKVALAAPKTSQLYQQLEGTIECFPIDYKLRLDNIHRWLNQAMSLKKWCEAKQFDIVHVNGSSDHTMLSLIKIFLTHKPRLVVTKHNSLPIKKGALLRLQYLTDAIIAVSQFTKRQLPASIQNHTKVEVILNGIDTDFYQPVSKAEKITLRSKYQFAADDFILVSVAGTATYKGWNYMVEAVANLPVDLRQNIKIVIAGPKPSNNQVFERIAQLNLQQQVFFPGLLRDVREAIAIGDVGFVLSHAVETISFACREMMAMAIPVITSDYAGLPENIAPNQDGWIVPAKDASALEQCLRQILASKDYRVMGAKARLKAETEFTNQQFVAKTVALYSELVAKSSL